MCFDLFKCCSYTDGPLRLPKEYELLDYLGEGSFGFVVRCKKKDTDEIVAVKISDNLNTLDEVQIMRKLMSHNLHQHNIVRFLGSFSTPCGLALVMEELDMTLWEHIKRLKWDLMPLSDIRNIIKQMAVALDALKSIGVIHGDIKPDNIMIVDHHRVKLIDFGRAVFTCETRLGMLLQHFWFRAPEVILGLPLNEAIDMWSLGCLLAIMFTRNPLFCGWTDNAILQGIIYHCGQPPDYLLNKALCTEKYFSRTETNGWTIKARVRRHNLNCRYEAHIKEKRLNNKDKAEALEALQCLDLLRAMLRVDPSERITPTEVLLHPFIDGAAPDDRTNIERDRRHPLSKIPLSRRLPVHPAEAENTLSSDDVDIESSESMDFYRTLTLGYASWTSTSDSEDSVTPPKEREATNIQPAHCSPSPTSPPSREIYVRPATAENTLRFEDQQSLESLVIHASQTSRPASWTSTSDSEDPVTAPKEREAAHCSPSPTSPPCRVIHVRPATAENTLTLEDIESSESLVIHVSQASRPASWTSTSDSEDPVTALKEREAAHCSPSPTSPPCQDQDQDQEDTDSLQAGFKNTSESPETITENDTTSSEDDFTANLAAEDFTYYGKEQLPQSPPPVTDLSSKKKKKKNCFRRFFSWMKKTFCSCVTCVDDN